MGLFWWHSHAPYCKFMTPQELGLGQAFPKKPRWSPANLGLLIPGNWVNTCPLDDVWEWHWSFFKGEQGRTEKAVKGEKSGFSISHQCFQTIAGYRVDPAGDLRGTLMTSELHLWPWFGGGNPAYPQELYAEGSDKELTSVLFILKAKYPKQKVTEVKLCQPANPVILPHLKLPYFLYWWE